MRRLKSISPDSALVILQEIYGQQGGEDLWEEVKLSWSEALLPRKYAELINNLQEGRITLDDEYRVSPVGLEEFLFEPFYLGLSRDEVWPEVLSSLKELNSGKYIEAILTGGIGVAKTTIALLTQAYQLYLLSCYRNPHRVLGITRSDEILFIFQNISKEGAKVVDYNRFKTMVDHSKYFTTAFPYDGNIESYLKFPFRIEVRPVTGKVTATMGQNVYSGIIDEINFMEVVTKSKRMPGQENVEYNQADLIYNSISTRRKSRFMDLGAMPGILCMVSSRNYPGQFTDKKEAERAADIQKTGSSPIYLYDRRTWELRPEKFSKETFKVFVGNDTMKPRILRDFDIINPNWESLVYEVPVDYKGDFERDIYQAIRDILGISTLARWPFMPDVDAVSDCMDRELRVLSADSTDFAEDHIKIFYRRFVKPHLPRWAHIDLGLTSDSAGVCMGTVPEFVLVERGEVKEVLPFYHIDFTLEVRPPRGGEILFYKIRDLLYKIRERGVNVKWVSWDSWQSKDSQQIMRSKGFMTGEQSIDRTMVPYNLTKTAILDRRVSMPRFQLLRRELTRLERDQAKGKIDHPPGGSKDVADSLAGVVSGLTMRREIWTMHNIPLGQIPESVAQALSAQLDAKAKMSSEM